MNSLTAFAAAVSSATNANASAGIFNYNTSVKCEKTKMSLSQVKRAHSDECSCSSDSHQIGTNLADQSVCWHRVSMSDNCQNCGHPFYEANQFLCNKCNATTNHTDETISTQINSLIEKIMPVESLLTKNETNISVNNDSLKMEKAETSDEENLAKCNFEQEFSSLIINSNLSSAVDSLLLKHSQSLLKLSDQIDLISNTTTTNSISPFSSKDLIEQIQLFNKYNKSKLTELKYELNDDIVKVFGVLKIFWNLKNPIKISVNDSQFSNEIVHNKQDSFKATSVRDLNEKKCWDDSSLLRNATLTDDYSTSSAKKQALRSQSVKCKPTKWKRTPLTNMQCNESIQENYEDEEQMFIPSYGSMSSICIESQTSCSSAIKILLEKFHISNSANEFSLYKVYQTGDKKELKDTDFPLIQRLWMGPFNEDKIFIMEKGRQLNMSQDLKNLTCLPETLLQGLIDNSKQEELKEINNIRAKYASYSKVLREHLKRQE